MKKRSKRFWWVCGILACLLVLREIGILPINLYISKMQTQSSSVMSKSGFKENETSCNIRLKNSEGRVLHLFSFNTGNGEPIVVDAILQQPTYSGNTFLPLFKTFQMSYKCPVETVSELDAKIEGELEGTVQTRIYGFCTRHKAKQLAFEEAQSQIENYFQIENF